MFSQAEQKALARGVSGHACAGVCAHTSTAQPCLLRNTDTPVAVSTPTPIPWFLNAFLHYKETELLGDGAETKRDEWEHPSVPPRKMCPKNDGVISKEFLLVK